MKIFFYLAQFIIYFGESQITWKEIYNSQNWDDQNSQYPKQNWVYSNIDGGPFSQCGDSKLFGGYGVFGKSSFVSSNLILPTHNSIRITFDFWKIDQWDGEYFRCLIDDKKAAYKTYWGTQGESICGLQLSDCLEYVDTITITISPHLSPSLIVFMTSDLNSSSLDESWGFNNFKIEITECPEGCQFCKDLTSPCDHWFNFASYWNSQDESDRWQIDNNEQLGFSECANLKIAGGNGTLSGGNSIQKLIETLIPHFRVQIVFKLWGIGSWNNELFNLDIDDNTIYTNQINTLDSIIKFSQQNVIIINIDVSTLHSSSQIKIKMSTAQNLVQNAYWGVSSFNLYVAKCSVGCEVCTGDITSQCIKCVKKFGLQKSKCIPAPPLECSYVRINQVVGLIVNLINPFQLKIVELDLIMNEIGSKQLFVDDIISSISLQIQVQCQEQKVISSYFRTCDGCESEQFSFYNLCLNQSNTIVYNTIFLQILESEKELLITMSQQKIEIIQISIINDVETEILILKIEI